MAIIFHVGAHKTGTSLIQKYFRDRFPDFDEGAIANIGRGDANHLIGWGDMLINHPDRLQSRLEDELQGQPENVILSHECALGKPFGKRAGIYPKTKRNAKALHSVIETVGATEDVKIAFYVRPVSSFVESFYLQMVHQGAFDTFEKWYEQIDIDSLSWMPSIEALDSVFGEENVLIGDFNEIRDGQENYLATFMQRTGIRAPETIDYTPRRNFSVSSLGLEIALNINPHLETPRQRKAMRKFMQDNFSNATGERAKPMPQHIRDEIDSLYEDEYSIIAKRANASKSGTPDRAANH